MLQSTQMVHKKFCFKLAIATILLIFSTLQANATTVRPLNITELTGSASVIFKGRCIDKSIVEEDNGQLSTYFTFQVIETLKGTAPESNQVVFKQVAQGEYTVGNYNIRRNLYLPEYQLDKTYLLFLPEAHHITGYLAPIGLDQGVFEVESRGGHEVLPALQTRARLLKLNLNQSSQTRLLQKINTATSDQSYDSFKAAINSALEDK